MLLEEGLQPTNKFCPECKGKLLSYPEQDGPEDFTMIYYCDNCKEEIE